MMTTSMGKTEWLNFMAGVAGVGNFYLSEVKSDGKGARHR